MKRRTAVNRFAVALLALMAAGAPAQTTLFSDDFSRLSDGTQPDAARWLFTGARDAGFWIGEAGALSTGNLDQVPSGLSFAFINTPAARQWTDVRIGTDIMVGQTEGSVALAVRVKDSKNFYFANLQTLPGRSGPGAVRVLELARMIDGSPRPIISKGGEGQPPLPIAPFESTGEVHRFELEAKGSTLTVYFDGQQVLSATDPELSHGAAGIGASRNEVVFDNVRVVPAGTPLLASADDNEYGYRASTTAADVWRLRVASGLTQDAARESAARLAGYPNVEVMPKDGHYAVYLGSFATREEAQAEYDKLLHEDGVLLEEVERIAAAPGGASSGGATSGGSDFRVLAGTFASKQEAEKLRDDLESKAGVFIVEVVARDGQYQVLPGSGFATRQEAEDFAAELRPVAPQATVLTAEVDLGKQATDISLRETVLAGASLSPEEREEAQRALAAINDPSRRRNDAGEQLSPAVQKVLDDYTEMTRRQQRVETLFTEVAEALKTNNLVLAENRLKDIKALDPRNVAADAILSDVQNRLRSGGDAGSQINPVEKLKADADAAEQAGRLDDALQQWRRVKDLSPSVADRRQADAAIERISQDKMRAIADSATAPEEQSAEGSGMMMVVLGAVGGLAVIGVLAFVLMGRRKAAPAPSSASIPTAVNGASRPGSGPVKVGNTLAANQTPQPAARQTPQPAAAAPAPAQEPARAQAAPPVTVSSSDRIRPGVVSPAPGGAPATARKEGGAAVAAAADAEAATTVANSDSLSLPEAVSPADAEPAHASAVFATPPMPDTAPNLHGATPVPAGAPVGSPDDYYVQTFDDEAVGKAPNNWKGSYDYATLEVVERPGGGGKCMKFEKKSGTGSAYYSCRFPDAGGRVVVEFDMLCVDKNKYLLGFYVEKDEDFRHSIHTVVHKDTSKSDKVSLRLQNEPAPYTLGEWCHVKFLIDLPRHLVDGYVNDKPVAVGVRLVSRPKVVNTLSIRDNLATEGVLMIDNIRIYRDR